MYGPNDQMFLLNFITGTYLGPDISSDEPKRSVLTPEGLRVYEPKKLGSSFLTLEQLEWLYAYLLKDVLKCHRVNGPNLHRYFNSKLPTSGPVEDARQFNYFFPEEKHAQEKRGRSCKKFLGIVMICNPDTSQIPVAALHKFKFLTYRRDVAIDLQDFELFCNKKKEKKSLKRRQDFPNNGNYQKAHVVQPISQVPLYPTNGTDNEVVNDTEGLPTVNKDDVLMLKWHEEVPPGVPDVHIGIAKEGSLGQVYIGHSTSAYLFRVFLPGADKASVKCELEPSGKVTVSGVTQTREIVQRNNQAFTMSRENLPPAGDFAVSFYLPGPVDSRDWKGTFEFGLLEGIVGKADRHNEGKTR